MALQASALIDVDFYNTLSGEDFDDDDEKIIALINAATSLMENFCNRYLKARDFTYDTESENYDQRYSIFDGPKFNQFWFPTYPLNSLTEFIISDVEIILATDYTDTTGYFLYPEKGLLVFDGGFDYGYMQNVTAIWNGGYVSGSIELTELQMMCYELVKNFLSAPENSNKISEKIGNYSYTLNPAAITAKMMGLSPSVFGELGKYKREIFA